MIPYETRASSWVCVCVAESLQTRAEAGSWSGQKKSLVEVRVLWLVSRKSLWVFRSCIISALQPGFNEETETVVGCDEDSTRVGLAELSPNTQTLHMKPSYSWSPHPTSYVDSFLEVPFVLESPHSNQLDALDCGVGPQL